jgi:hypothetical protein
MGQSQKMLCAPTGSSPHFIPDGVLGQESETLTLSRTSFAVPFVTGVVALLWSAFPSSTVAEVKSAIMQSQFGRRTSVVPPLLNALTAYHAMAV